METCKICKNELGFFRWVYVDVECHQLGKVHGECARRAMTDAIAAREAEKPKEVTLETKVIDLLYRRGHIVSDATAPLIIAMVREHDGTTDWKARAEKAEAKLAAIRSELST